MNPARYAIRFVLGLIIVTTVASLPLLAQQGSSPAPSKDEQPKPAAGSSPWAPNGSAVDGADVGSSPPGPPNPYGGAIKDAGTGLPLLGTAKTPLRWGSFSIDTFEYIGVHDNFDRAGTSNTISTNLYILRTGLMFDHYLLRSKSRIVLHYLPQMAITNGELHGNAAANNNLSLGAQLELSPRLTLTLNDSFLQSHSNPLIPQHYLAVDSDAGQLVQNNFLNTNGSFVSNSASAVFDYGVSPRTHLTFSPLYRFARTTGNIPNYVNDGHIYAGLVTLGHAFSPHRTIGITESYQYLREAASSGKPETAAFNTSGLYYSEQLARTFWVTGNLGAVTQSYSGSPSANSMGLSGGFSLIKQLTTRIGVAVAYTRGVMFSSYVTRQRADRADGSLGIDITRRISWNNGFGYYREVGVEPRTNGKYTTTNFAYRLYGSFSLFGTFAYTFQSSSTPQMLSGDRRTIAYGIRWAPPMLFSK